MKIIKNINNVRDILEKYRLKNKTIGFVPTMGALHKGHLSLIRKARKENDIVVVSIFVNPIQFGRGEDFSKYPRQFKKDKLLAQKEGVDLLFVPSLKTMYPNSLYTYVEVEKFTEVMCGISRPSHFRGVLTVVAKLFNIITPDKAYFGQKDYQQAFVVKKMVYDLNFPVKIIVCPTVREKDGLALSSRNSYLSASERKGAVCIWQSLKLARSLIRQRKDTKFIIQKMRNIILKNKSAKIDYIDIRDAETLSEIKRIEKNKKILIAASVFIGKIRLIDNIQTTDYRLQTTDYRYHRFYSEQL